MLADGWPVFGRLDMVSMTFQGLVTNGQLKHHESLTPFGGRRVYVTVIAPTAETAELPPRTDEPPPDLDVETDVFVRMEPRSKTLLDVPVVDAGAATPRVILPGELPDA
jgi:hypothetical protein